MKKAALDLRAALMILPLTMGLLSIRSSGSEITHRDVSSWDVMTYEELFCWQCGEWSTF